MQVLNQRVAKALETAVKYCAEHQDSNIGKCSNCSLSVCLVTGFKIAPEPVRGKSTIGERYGLWKVTSDPVREGSGNRSTIRVECVCECGYTASIQYRTLKNGVSTGCKSCKCGRKKG